MANKTQPTGASVDDFLARIDDVRRRADAKEVHQLMSELTGETGVLWGSSIIGYGELAYRAGAGRSGDWFPIGFSPREASLVLYFMEGPDAELLARLGKHKRGVGCVYIATLEDIDREVLRALIARATA
jgi:Domain of unknown function (DU1801)